MKFNPDGFGDLFDDSEDGMVANIEQVMEHMSHLMTDHDMPPTIALESLLNLVKPGTTDMSHDVLQHFMVAMHALGHPEAAKKVKCLWFTHFPWGLGFHFGFERGFNANDLPQGEKHAIVQSLAAILSAGGIEVSVTDDDLLHVKEPGKKDQSIDMVVTKFRNEMDAELGPDAPTNDLPRNGPDLRDWLKRWMPDQE